ncbi:hypothetical protein [Malonomonas rubra]|uniref:hypothetical protein n=1 Tax=Malonomonas rubra TaxID=57040 RepID=UPI0026EA4948|nr:hypothetical protein [Malonomonas rubra]
MKANKTLIVTLAVLMTLLGAFSIFAWDHYMYGSKWSHMNGWMGSQSGDHMSDHATDCWTGSDQNWQHDADHD